MSNIPSKQSKYINSIQQIYKFRGGIKMKYIIELDDEPIRPNEEGSVYISKTYKATNFKTLFFNEEDLEKLEKIDLAKIGRYDRYSSLQNALIRQEAIHTTKKVFIDVYRLYESLTDIEFEDLFPRPYKLRSSDPITYKEVLKLYTLDELKQTIESPTVQSYLNRLNYQIGSEVLLKDNVNNKNHYIITKIKNESSKGPLIHLICRETGASILANDFSVLRPTGNHIDLSSILFNSENNEE